MLAHIANDLRAAARALWQQPGFVLPALLTLALGIGANTAIFSAVDALLVQPLPFHEADRLVRIASLRGGAPGTISYREVQDLRSLASVFVDVAAYTDQGQYNASGVGRPEELVSTITTHNLFKVLGVPLTMGQPWPETLDYTRDFKLVISHTLWERRFGSRPDILGQAIVLDGAPGYTILGVLPKGFAFPIRSDLYRSHGITSAFASYEDRSLRGRWGVGRLAPGVTVEQAQQRVSALARRLEREFPESNAGIDYTVIPLRNLYVGEARPFLLLLLAAVSLVLLIACCNVANLHVSRGLGRQREIAVRSALGAQRRDILRLLLAESLILGLGAGLLGVLLGIGGVRLIAQLVRLDLPVWLTISVSWRVLLFTAALSITAGVLAGLLPALRAGRSDPSAALRAGGRGSIGEGRRQRALRSALVVTETALATMLLVGAGLMVQSFRAITRSNPGFNGDSLLTFRVEQGWAAYPVPGSGTAFKRILLERLHALPGVQVAALVSNLPLSGRPKTDHSILIEGQDATAQRGNPFVNMRIVSPGLFDALRIPLQQGRFLSDADRDTVNRVAVISQSLARRFWPDRSPIGARIRLGQSAGRLLSDSLPLPWHTVVGVVGDVRHDALTAAPSLDAYLSFEQASGGGSYFLLRVAGDPLLLAQRATELVWGINPDQSFFDVRTMQSRVADRTWVPRLSGALFSAFGALAATLAALGVYAVLAFTVAQRRAELSVRQALGASRAHLSGQVILYALRLAALGGVIGLVAAYAFGRALSGMLYEVAPANPAILIGSVVLLLIVALAAAWLPARRAMLVEPMEAIRAQV